MPNKGRKPGRRRARGRNIDTIHYPLIYEFAWGSGGETFVRTLADTFDRRRPFRIAGLYGEFSAQKAPTIVQFMLWGPANSADNVWSSKLITISTGTTRRFRFRVPVTATGWYPSDTSPDTRLMAVYSQCPSKSPSGMVVGHVYVVVAMRPIELSHTCPSLMEVAPTPGTSGIRARGSECSTLSSIEVISSDDEYFST